MHPALRAPVPYLLAAALWWSSGSARAEVPAELAGREVVEVKVGGESAAMVPVDTIGITPGVPLTRALVREAIEQLLESGRWVDVQVDAARVGEGVRLTFLLRPRVLLQRIQVTGSRELDERTVRDALKVTRESEVSAERLPSFEQAVRSAYTERGFLSARVDVRLRDTDDPSRKVLMVDIVEGRPTRITRLEFSGEQPLDAHAMLVAMQVRLHDVFDRKRLAEGVTRGERFLRERGFLEAELGSPLVTVAGDRARVTVPTRIGPRYEVAIRGQEPLSRGDVYEALDVLGERLTPDLLATGFAERVTDLYARRGYHDTKVQVLRLRGRKKNSMMLLVQIDPGKQLQVIAVSFTGARHFERGFLEEQLFSYLEEDLPGSSVTAPVDSEVADGLLHGQSDRRRRDVPAPPITNPEEVFYGPTYEEAIAHIVELYQAEGYLSAKVGPARLSRIGKNRAAVMIPVVEGPRTRLHSVVLEGTRVVSPRELLAAAGLERDQPFSYLRLEEARIRMLEHYHERGHMFAKVEPTVRFSRDQTRAEVTIQVVERFPVHVERVVIQGADRTSKNLIRRLLAVEAGAIYRPSLARESEEELRTLGVFTAVSVALMDPELPARVKPVLVTVSERRNQFLDFTAGLSTGQGVRAGFEYGYRNLFGQAVGLSLRVQFAHQLLFVNDELEQRFEQLTLQDRLERRVTLGTVIPRLPFLGPVRTNIDLTHLRDNERDFGLDKNGIGLTFTYSPINRVTLTLGGDLENNNVDLFVSEALNDYLATASPRLKRLLRVPEGSSTLVAARLSAAYDRRDSPFVPTRGFFVSGAGELARTLTTDEPGELQATDEFVSRFVKLSATASGYIPLGLGVVLAGQTRAGRIVHLVSESKTYPNRAFFLGGVETIRGYFQDEMVPQDVADEIAQDPDLTPDSIVRSGDAFVLLRGEARFPLYGQLQAGLFTDVGNLWADPANVNPFQLRPTGGVGLRLATPVGPVAVDYGVLFKRRRALREPFGTLHFSIGLF